MQQLEHHQRNTNADSTAETPPNEHQQNVATETLRKNNTDSAAETLPTKQQN